MVTKPCVFCEIERGERDAEVVLEDPRALAFLDERPLFPGHCLVIPRLHQETLLDLPEPELGPLLAATQLVARALEQALGCDGTFVANNNRVSQSVPHLHLHVVPRRFKDGLRGFFWPRQAYRDDGHAREVAAAVRAAVQELKAARA